jgi:hypothetical protein
MAAGNPLGELGGAIGSLIGKGVQKYKNRKPEAKLANHLDNAIKSALDEKTSKYMAAGVPARQAVIKAAEELYGSTQGSKQSPEFRDRIRAVTMSTIANMGEFSPDARNKFAEADKFEAEAKSKGAEANKPEDIKSILNLKTNQRLSLGKGAALSLVEKYPGEWVETDTLDQEDPPKDGDQVSITMPNGDKRQLTLDKDKKLFPDLPHSESGYVDVTEKVSEQRAAKQAEDDEKDGLAKDRLIMSERRNFNTLQSVKDYKKVKPIFEAAKASAKDDTSFGDINMIYAMVSIFDPDSVVRESEIELSRNAAPWLQNLVGAMNKQLRSRGFLTEDTKNQLLQAVERRATSYQKAYQADRAEYGRLSGGYGVSPDDLTGPDLDAVYGVQSSADRAKELGVDK